MRCPPKPRLSAYSARAGVSQTEDRMTPLTRLRTAHDNDVLLPTVRRSMFNCAAYGRLKPSFSESSSNQCQNRDRHRSRPDDPALHRLGTWDRSERFASDLAPCEIGSRSADRQREDHCSGNRCSFHTQPLCPTVWARNINHTSRAARDGLVVLFVTELLCFNGLLVTEEQDILLSPASN
jgi:hypothetical protein